ncbi:phosphoglucosamine mutase [Plesiocystis pacifica SIR-1]|uniref:Phosphoglucosamine mutase n=1 Tax=Plesiocystis pacifica SIR-1 TaxID=391625 RepID=A6GKI4_9BACT|nr:phosphoglucosamine mutase [Plesiocystis pacifica]EDM73623.1 phosphoglucosamine mutase [Plesiocystis pacifica SIR-1]
MSKQRKLFGTDGIRGRANVHPMTPEVAMRFGMAVAAHFGREGKVVVGKDTRRSGYMFEMALASGLCALGVDVMLTGPLPTPGVAHLASSMRADAGVVISASHNPFEDNGFKLFANDGFKLPDTVESHIEALMERGAVDDRLAHGESIGKAWRLEDAGGRYITHVKHALPQEYELDGLRIVVDCANGAAYKIAPAVFEELGADVVRTGVRPDGTNINAGVGAMHPEHLSHMVREYRADIGVALDGDADRAVVCDAKGKIVDGDVLLAIIGRDLAERSALRGNAVVATVMSNIGLERSLAEVGVGLHRTPVGDRYVVEAMRSRGCNLGGEQSGHIISLDHSTTGDGLVSALSLLAVMVRAERPLAELAAVMTRYPQVSRSYLVPRKVPLGELTRLAKVIAGVEERLADEGRVVVRYSGTESKLRVMVEGGDERSITEQAEEIGDAAVAEIAAKVG